MKWWKKIYHANGNHERAGVAIVVSGKTDFKIRTVKRENGHYLIIKGGIE